MDYCYDGKEPELPADLFPKFPDTAKLSASFSDAVKTKLPTKIPGSFPSCFPSAFPSTLPESCRIPPQMPRQFQLFRKGIGRHYKCVESILRRIAANLGNSPSQTDVKIVSCIPIDVTDLQQRIFNLERELEESKKRRKVHKVESPGVVAKSSACRPCLSFNLNNPPCKCNPTRPKITLSQSNYRQKISKQKHGLGLLEVQEPPKCEKAKFGKKTIKMRLKGRTKHADPFVYYVQTETSPFGNLKSSIKKSRVKNLAQVPIAKKSEDDRHKDSVARIADSMTMKYTSQLLAAFSSSSEYSAPVCRDAMGVVPPPKREPDVFSCRGKFLNLDNDIKNLCNDGETSSCSKYYDDSLYDLVPVKEKSKDVKKNACVRKRKDHNDSISRMPNHVIIPEETNFVMNYTFDNQGFPTYSNFRKIPEYAKSSKSNKKDGKKRIDALTRKNASCLTIRMNNIECQTTSEENSQLNTTPKMTKNAENTLNEIKETLQTVLETVKTNSRLKYNSEKGNNAIVNQIECARSEMIKQNLKLKPPHQSGPIQMFYTPIPFINSTYMSPCIHHSSNNPSAKTNSKQKENVPKPEEVQNDSQNKVTEIWKPETENGKTPIFISTSKRDESTPKNRNDKIIRDTSPLSEHDAGTPEVVEKILVMDSESSKLPEEENSDDRLSLVEENVQFVDDTSESGIEAEDEEEGNESEYEYEDVSEDNSVIFNGPKNNEDVIENANEKLGVVSSELLEEAKSIVEEHKEKKLDKILYKVFHFFKTKPGKSDKLSTKKEKKQSSKKIRAHSRSSDATTDNDRSLRSSKTDWKQDKKRKSSTHSVKVLHVR